MKPSLILPVWTHLLYSGLLLANGVVANGQSAEFELRHTAIEAPVESAVPAITAQGHMLAPQAISALDISPDGGRITVGTMAFSHEPNVWLFDSDGAIREKVHLPPWAPFQVATFAGGQQTAAGLAMSRVTSPEPDVWCGSTEEIFHAPLKDEFNQADSRDGQFSRWRFGEGDWKTGWLPSCFGELFAHGPDWFFQPPNLFIGADGRRQHLRYEDGNLLPTHRAARMVTSADGKQIAFGWLCLDEPVPGFSQEKSLLSVWNVLPNRSRWSAAPSGGFELAPLPDPTQEFSGLLTAGFRLQADKLARGSLATALALNHDASRVALIEYGVWIWMRSGPAIGQWDPPIHAINFVPNQRGRLRVFNGDGKELCREWLPENGLFEVGFGNNPDEVTCWPASWFARGMAGQPWLPTSPKARTVYRVNLKTRSAEAFDFPDAISDCSVCPVDGRELVSCWNGKTYLQSDDGKFEHKFELTAPARLAWSPKGEYAVAGTADGKLFRLEADGKMSWQKEIPVSTAPTIPAPLAEVVPGIPIYQGGRLPQGEHAYVGDIWILKLGKEAVIVDSGGTSGFATSQARVKALGIERVTHVLHTHSHGDHCGGAYLWRALGAKIVAPQSASLTLTWLMPMLTDYGIFPPRPVDVPLPLSSVGDETEFEVSGQKFRALFVPGHSFDLTIYMTELGGKRIAFTGDLGFEGATDIVHRCWGDASKAHPIVKAVREKLLPWKPDVVFTGHGVRRLGSAWLEDLLRRSEESLTKAEKK